MGDRQIELQTGIELDGNLPFTGVYYVLGE